MDKTEKPLQVNLSVPRSFPLGAKMFQILAEKVVKEEILQNKRWKSLIRISKVINIKLVTNRQIKKINRGFLGSDYATDVIAFSYIEKGVAKQRDKDEPVVLGEVVVSHEMAASRCGEYKNPFKRELALYIIHGVLHIFGYDDLDERSYAKMWRKQNDYLKKYYPKEKKRKRV